MRTITATMPAWLANEWTSPEELYGDDQQKVAELLAYYKMECAPHDWVRVGTATLIVELFDRDELIASKADSIRAEIQKTQADAVVKVNALTEKLNSLLAITYKPEV